MPGPTFVLQHPGPVPEGQAPIKVASMLAVKAAGYHEPTNGWDLWTGTSVTFDQWWDHHYGDYNGFADVD